MRKDSIDKVAAARSQSACLVLTLYCENVDCAGREVVVTVKDHDRTLVAQLAKPEPCPLCRQPLKFHHVVTFAQHEAQDERMARCSVNTQMYQRDTGTPLVPGSVLLDDRLPPTPTEWFPR
jgi:hypothetical protein